MKVVAAIVFAVLVGILIPVSAQEAATLYSPLQYNHDHSRAYFDFHTGEVAKRGAAWDLAYGLLRAGGDDDWFQSGNAVDSRTVIKDLGKLKWTDIFAVPIIEPLPKLKPGERRTITIDVSGADGADGANGAPGAAGAPGRRGDESNPRGEMQGPPPRDPFPESNVPLRGPKRDGKPKIDPIFVKAIVGHLYAIHVVNDTSDFYALFRVDALTRGDNCTISWRLVPAPTPNTARKEN